MKSLRLNGETRSDIRAVTVAQLVHELDLVGAALLIEHNGVVLYRQEWTTTQLQTGDQIELLRLAPGG